MALTAYARIEDRVNILAAGFQMHVSKFAAGGESIAESRDPLARVRDGVELRPRPVPQTFRKALP